MNVVSAVHSAFAGLQAPLADELDPRNYREGYWALLDLFEAHVRLEDRPSMIAGATAVYGWMPRIFRKLREYSRIMEPLEQLRNASSGTEALTFVQACPHPEILLRFVDGSVVGTSKFLHFLNPKAVPVWDSRVASNFGIGAAGVTRTDRFLDYWSGLSACEADPPAAFRDFCRAPDGRDAPRLRLMEYALFLNGKHDKQLRPRRAAKTPLVA
jgi:hypothetical protein